VWKELWPPFHYSCRTYVRGIYDEAELEALGGAVAAYRQGNYAAPQKGVGGYPLDKESYWRLTPEMVKRAREYGIDGEIAAAAVKLGMKNYAMELVKDYKTVYTSASGGYVKQSANSIHNDNEIAFAEKAADENHRIYLLPENKRTKNPDMIFDDEAGDIKQLTSTNPARIDDAVKDAGHKGATMVLIEIPSSVSKEDIVFQIKDRMRHSTVKTALVHWNGTFFLVK
jgi:hypothetical protein